MALMGKAAAEDPKNPVVGEVDPGDYHHPFLAWMCVLASCIFLLMGSASLNMLTPVLQLMLDEFNETKVWGGSLSSIDTVVSAIAVVPAAFLMNKYGFRFMGYFGYAMLILSAFYAAFLASTPMEIMAVRAVQGVGYVVPPILSIWMVTQWFPENERAFPISIVASMTAFAKVLCYQMSKITIPLGGWRAQYAFFGILCVLGFILFFFFMRKGPGYAGAEAARRQKEEDKKDHAPIVEVLKEKRIWVVVLLGFCYSVVQRGYLPFANIIMVDNCGVSNDTASDINSLLQAMKVIGEIGVGLIMARFLAHRGKTVIAIFSVYFIAMATVYTINQPWQAWSLVITIGLCGGIASFNQLCLPMFSRTPQILTMALMLYDLFGKYLAATVAPLIIAFVQRATGSWYYCSIPVLIAGAVGFACLCYMGITIDRETKRKKLEEAAAKADGE